MPTSKTVNVAAKCNNEPEGEKNGYQDNDR